MFKTRYPLPGTPPATLTALGPGEGHLPQICLLEYDGTGLTERKVASVEELPPLGVDDGKTRWIEFNGLGDLDALKALGEKYKLHPLTLEDVLNTGQRPKMERYDDYLFIVAQMIYRDTSDERMIGEQVSMFLSKGLLITVQEDPGNDVFEPVRARVRGNSGIIRKSGADYLAYTLLDAIVDHCFPILECIGEGLDELEDEMLARPSTAAVSTLHDFRRTLLQLRRVIWPERDLVNALLHDESGVVSNQTKLYLRDCYDHAVRIMDLVESYREIAGGLLELYLSAVGLRTNEVMRVLTVISAIFIPLTFIAGVYGMNFQKEKIDPATVAYPLNMPELHMRYGYVTCIALMFALAIGMLVFFRRKKWI